MEQPLRILILEDSAVNAEIIQRFLVNEKMQCEFSLAMNKNNFLKELEVFSPDVILSDNSLPQLNASEALKITRNQHLNIPFILVTGTVSEEYAANIIKEGADDYILKDRMSRLPVAIEAALNKRRTEREIADYRYALDQSAIVAITDQKGKILYANDNFCKISKYTIEELIGKDHRIINSGYHPSFYIKNMWTTIANGRIWRGEFCNRAKDGELYWVDTHIIPFLDPREKPYQYLAIRTDITEKKMAEEELRKNESRLNEAQSIAHISNWEIDLGQNVHIWSDELYNIYGINKTEVKPSIELFLSFMHPDNAAFAQKKIEESLQTAKDSKLNFRFIRKDGAIRHAYSVWRFEFDKKGNPIRLYGILQDITERKEAEDELNRMELKLLEQKRQEQIKITATALEAQEKERNAIGIELHDNVNQLLVGINLMLSVGKTNPKKTQEMIDIAMNGVKEAILENRKIAHVFVAPSLDTETLTDHLKNLVDTMIKQAGIKTKILFTKFCEDLLDKERKINIYRIAQEQFTNIIKYAKATEVNISLTTLDNLFKMSIDDNGVGFDITKKVEGIGLKNISGRLSIFGGYSNVVTSPGKGFKLSVVLPCKK
jgi:PAS domain S-box-containing protein